MNFFNEFKCIINYKIRKMNNLKKLRYLSLGVLLLVVTCTGNQQRKIEQDEFCSSLKSFDKALNDLAVANAGDDEDAFNKAFEKAVKDWKKLVTKASDLEDLQMDQTVEAYNRLVSKVNRIADNTRNTDAVDDINNEIDKTAAKIADIQTTICK